VFCGRLSVHTRRTFYTSARNSQAAIRNVTPQFHVFVTGRYGVTRPRTSVVASGNQYVIVDVGFKSLNAKIMVRGSYCRVDIPPVCPVQSSVENQQNPRDDLVRPFFRFYFVFRKSTLRTGNGYGRWTYAYRQRRSIRVAYIKILSIFFFFLR